MKRNKTISFGIMLLSAAMIGAVGEDEPRDEQANLAGAGLSEQYIIPMSEITATPRSFGQNPRDCAAFIRLVASIAKERFGLPELGRVFI